MHASRWHALRVLWQRPGFALAVCLTAALGIGANTTIFSIVNGVLLRPLPYAEPDRLVQIQSLQARGGDRPIGASAADYLDWRQQSRTLERLALYSTLDFNLPGEGAEALPVRVNFATSELVALLGVPPLVGRAFIHAEEQPGEDLYSVILSHDLWRRRFGSDPRTIGRIIKLDTTDYRVVGVMPPGFRFPDNADAWAPLESWLDRFKRTPRSDGRDVRGYSAIARRRSGVDAPAVQLDLDTIAQRLEREFPQTNGGVRFRATPLRDAQIREIRAYLPPLGGAALFVGLIACVNVINLLLARAAERRKEIAVRVALGASRSALIRSLLAESLMLSAMGGAGGLALSLLSVHALQASIPIDLPLWMTFELDWRVLSYTCAIVLIIGVVSGLAPALQAFRVDHERVLREEGRAAVRARASRLGRDVLVVCEVSFSLALLVGAGLMLRTFAGLRQVDPGFRSENLLVVYVSPPGDRYKAASPYPAYASLYRQVLTRLKEVPGVEGAAGSRVIPYAGKGVVGPGNPIAIEGQSTAEEKLNPPARTITISSDYFRVAGIPLLKGRAFTDEETLDRPRVAIINQALASRFWPNADPIGQRIKRGALDSTNEWHTVVGVVGNVKYAGLHAPSEPTLYYPYTQATAGDFNFLVRTQGAPLNWIEAVQREIRTVDRDLAIYSLRSMDSILASSIWQQRLWSTVFLVFAVVAAALATIGIYSVLSWSVRRRHRELGVRVALGAERRDIVTLILGQGMRLAGIGIACGLAASLVLARSLSSLLFRVSASDPLTWIGVSALLLLVCAAACYLPARRASALDPIAALNTE